MNVSGSLPEGLIESVPPGRRPHAAERGEEEHGGQRGERQDTADQRRHVAGEQRAAPSLDGEGVQPGGGWPPRGAAAFQAPAGAPRYSLGRKPQVGNFPRFQEP